MSREKVKIKCVADVEVGVGANSAVNGRSASVEHPVRPQSLAVGEQISASVRKVAMLAGRQVGQRHDAARIFGIVHERHRRQVFRQLVRPHAALF